MTIPKKIDLHMHNTVSDGSNTPAELLDCVRQSGLELFALTDHDTTDGLAEATNNDEQMFGTDRMIRALNEVSDAGPKEVLENVRESVDAFVGTAEQFDDLTMLCLEYRGPDGKTEG